MIAGRDDLGATGREGLEKYRGLRLEVQGHPDPVAGEGAGLQEVGVDGGEQRHPGPDPLCPSSAAFGEFIHDPKLTYMNLIFICVEFA
ncbi:hypothetical protein GCM10022239_12590 [Leifsonia bigeumensis]|uniref:Uncharacterized protein n=1 Tax=Leifsonella bigeumensis TaxID=433643 RepID=A0ABP7FKV3_9MICO